MPAKKQSQHNQDTVFVDSGATGTIGGYGAVPGTDTITLDPSTFTSNVGIISGSITSPYVYTTNGTAGYTINSNPTNIHIDADGVTMKKGSDIKIGGKSLSEAIDKIEQRLAILTPNPELESRWKQLQELREQYVELERDLLEKEKLMKILKET